MIPPFGSRFEPEGRGFESLPACHSIQGVADEAASPVFVGSGTRPPPTHFDALNTLKFHGFSK